ncbi:hypothetical protein HDU76_009929 [Blyttiomyces sp. JEL0837]|nr:hypothetical protein HDU76_009929 [Blyttiomyces sp. JEL0837]
MPPIREASSKRFLPVDIVLPTSIKESVPFKSSWTIADLKLSLKKMTGLSVHEQVLLFQDHQLTDNIRPSFDELRVVAANGGFVLQRRGQSNSKKRLFSRGIRGLPTFIARNFGLKHLQQQQQPQQQQQQLSHHQSEQEQRQDQEKEQEHEDHLLFHHEHQHRNSSPSLFEPIVAPATPPSTPPLSSFNGNVESTPLALPAFSTSTILSFNATTSTTTATSTNEKVADLLIPPSPIILASNDIDVNAIIMNSATSKIDLESSDLGHVLLNPVVLEVVGGGIGGVGGGVGGGDLAVVS